MSNPRNGLFNAIVVSYDATDGSVKCMSPALFGQQIVQLFPRILRSTDIARIAPVKNGDVVQVFFPGGTDTEPQWFPTVIDTGFDAYYVKKAGDVMGGQLRAVSGTVGAPGLGVGDTDTGIASTGTDILDLVTAGVSRLSIGATGTISAPGPLLLADGTLANCALAFAGDPNNGLRRTGADGLSIVTAGVDRLSVDSGGVVRMPVMAETPVIRSAAAIEARLLNDAAVAPIYSVKRYEDILGASQAFTNVAIGSEVTMLSRNVTTSRANALITVTLNLEALTTGTGTGIAVVTCKVAGTAQSHNLNFVYPAVRARDPYFHSWEFTIATPATTTILLALRKSVNDGTINAGLTNTVMNIRVEE